MFPNRGGIFMTNQKMAAVLKTVILFLSVLGVGLFAGVVPAGLYLFVDQFPEFHPFFYPWLIFLSVFSVPLFVILGFGLAIAKEIGNDNSFSSQNVRYLSGISVCLLADSGYFFAGNLVLWVLNLNYPIVVLFAIALCLFAVTISATVRVLAQLVNKAVRMREENEAII